MLKIVQKMADVVITQLSAVPIPEMSQYFSLEDGGLRAIITLGSEHLQSSVPIFTAWSA
jgi:hypothetical protein